MAAEVKGVIREGREVSVDRYDWTESRATILVVADSTQQAVLAARDWWNNGVAAIMPWVATKFSAKPINSEGGVYHVDVTLIPWAQEVSNPDSPMFKGFSSTLESVESETDIYGMDVDVQHTYPSDDPDYPGQTKHQRPTVQIARPVFSYVRTMHKNTWTPGVYQWLIGNVNSHIWQGHDPGFVRCSSVKPKPMQGPYGGVPPLYAIQFTFDVNFSGWDELAVYTDPRTGKRPEANPYVTDLTVKRIPVCLRYNFNELFDTSEDPLWADVFAAEGL